MFDAWIRAWKDAVENFRRELDPELYGPASHRMTDAMRRDIATARHALHRVERELDTTRRDLARELENEENCRRREQLARGIDDLETAHIAAEYARRHAERAAVLRRKVDVLTAERDLLRRDLDAMLASIQQLDPGSDLPPRDADASRFGPTTHPDIDDDDGIEADFDRLNRQARERAAEARLEELKRKLD